MRLGDSSSKFAILGTLSLKPASGYDVKQFVQSSIGHFWNESYGSIYPILKKLAQSGLIQPQKGSRGGRERVVYAITPDGEKALREWLLLPPRPEPARSEILLKLFFARRTPARISIEQVHEKKLAAERSLVTYDRIREDLQREQARHPELPYWLITLSYGQHRSRAIVGWCKETLGALGKLQKNSSQEDPNFHRKGREDRKGKSM